MGWGISIASVVLGLFFAFNMVYPTGLKRNKTFTRGEVAVKFFSALLIMGIIGASLFIQVRQLQVRYAENASDPQWTSFPPSCRNNSINDPGTPVLNCAHVGYNVPNPSPPYNDPSLLTAFPPYNAPLSVVQSVFAEIATEWAKCSMLYNNETTGFFHARCLTNFLGYPDDLAFQVQCVNNQSQVWLHSQSRLIIAEWDWGYSDARLRYIQAFIEMPTNWFPYHSQLYNSTAVLSETCT
eukprot:TRINITY_DN2017_c0_g1_i5.p2 TRINITY_DN2017_c0_g1~~TRINITY_DN2017_c0_g1_i5.p2  ORF type:complete len:239 (+),score=38.20 TRINITY_DN2017_c0_g1_i5:380-1096(+)